jgi:mannose-6-phosphate isomerase-like protein (cupin superfamily)
MTAMHGLRIVRWADDAGIDAAQHIAVGLGIRPESMLPGPGTGESLVSNGLLGADIIRLGAGERFLPHTHAGDHLLIVIGGTGTITVDGEIRPTRAGEMYMVEGASPHAVGAVTDHVLLAVGSPHVPVSSPDRMSAVPYRALTARFDDLHCLICQVHVVYPRVPHELGCPHCPCVACSAGGE